jgi:hypothetical protein
MGLGISIAGERRDVSKSLRKQVGVDHCGSAPPMRTENEVMIDLFKVTREPDRTVTDGNGVTSTVSGNIVDVRGSWQAVFVLPFLLALLALGTSAWLESIKLENAVELECSKRRITNPTDRLPTFCPSHTIPIVQG